MLHSCPLSWQYMHAGVCKHGELNAVFGKHVHLMLLLIVTHRDFDVKWHGYETKL